MELQLEQKLDILKQAAQFKHVLAFKFRKDRPYDKRILDWFIKHGDLRVYRANNNSYVLNLYANKLKLFICNTNNASHTNTLPWQQQYLSYVINNGIDIVYCINSSLYTVAEIQNAGNISNSGIFNLSTDTAHTHTHMHNKLACIKRVKQFSQYKYNLLDETNKAKN
jgi:hypothetical protein